MAGTTRREFTDEFKREAVALWATGGRLQIDVARELGVQASLLRRWQKQVHDLPASPPAGSRPAMRPASAAEVRHDITWIASLLFTKLVSYARVAKAGWIVSWIVPGAKCG